MAIGQGLFWHIACTTSSRQPPFEHNKQIPSLKKFIDLSHLFVCSKYYYPTFNPNLMTAKPKTIEIEQPDTHQDAHEEVQPTMDANQETVNGIIKRYTLISTASGLVPLPLWDLAALAGVQLKMIQELGNLYNLKINNNAGKATLGVATTTFFASSVTGLGASILKIIPGVGTLLGNAAFYGYAAASTYAVGKVFNQHFASGGTMLTFSPEKMKEAYRNHFNDYKAENESKGNEKEPASPPAKK